MTLEEALVAYLSSRPGVGNLVSDRVAAGRIDQGAPRPFLVVQTLGQSRVGHFGGADGLVQEDVQVRCVADTPAGAAALAEQVRLALLGYSGAMGDREVRRSFVLDASTSEPIPTTGGEEALEEVLLRASLWATETVPTF